MQDDINTVLSFWFEETTPDQKFKKDPKFDALVTSKFKDLYFKIMARETEDWKNTPEGRLAEIIVLDQFARNMFRDTPQSFEGDALALELAEDAVATGADEQIPEDRRVFLYMPFMHSESKEVHEKALKIFEKFGNKSYLGYEKSHKKIIDRFGRYPHRNDVLGRESTEEEIEYLKKDSGF